jgi:hypothetical protein
MKERDAATRFYCDHGIYGLCPKCIPTERSVVSDAAKTALDTLVEIVKDEDADPDVRIRAAATILNQEIQERVNPVGAVA